MTKNNIRSIRFSDELAELIDQQVGSSFTQKFENLITRCVWELPKKEEEIQRLDTIIERKRKELRAMQEQISKMSYTVNRILQQTSQLETAVSRELPEEATPPQAGVPHSPEATIADRADTYHRGKISKHYITYCIL